jgi:hypothetical protein
MTDTMTSQNSPFFLGHPVYITVRVRELVELSGNYMVC